MNEGKFQKKFQSKFRKKFDINSERMKLPSVQNNINYQINFNHKLTPFNNNIKNNLFNHNNPFNENNFNIQNKHKPYSGNPLKYNNKSIYQKENKKGRDITTANPVLITKLYYNFPVSGNFKFQNFGKKFKQPKSSPKYNKYLENSYKKNIKLNHLNNINNQIINNISNNNLLKSNSSNKLKSSVNDLNNYNNNILNENSEPIKINLNESLKKTIKPQNKIIVDAKKEKNNYPFVNYDNQDYPNLNHREKMEDYYISLPSFFNDTSKSYFAIFDGHSGIEVAKYCKDNLHKIFAKNLNETTFDVKDSLINSFNSIDEEISKLNYQKDIGSTATVLFIYKEYDTKYNNNIRYFAIANVGDSKCYLIKKKNIIKLTYDHKCSDEKEVERIKKNGGIVFYGRVFGTLMLTRSIGDREMKKYGVCSEPYVNIQKIENDDLFIILASDGVWDVINEEELFNICFEKDNLNSSDICKKIIQVSKDGDSRDNISCIVVKL